MPVCAAALGRRQRRLARDRASSEGRDVTSPIVSPEELRSELGDPRLVILDARAGADARDRFRAQHLRGARFVSGDHDLATQGDPAKGGRHPLPTLEVFSATLARLGVVRDSRIVVLDDKNGMNPAARAWWMLLAVGLDVRVLDGGLASAIDAGLPTEQGEASITPAAPMQLDRWQLPTVAIDRIDALSRSPSVPVLDARNLARHRGDADPFDPRPGHIPSTTNAPHEASLDANGRTLDAATLRARFTSLLGAHAPSEAIVYCGSGVTACHLLLAMEHAGLPGAALYVGSFSEWTRTGRPVATGEGT
jgi:thiosulfate/3-mercaptopyruvate sulfurtransferase